MSANNLVFFFFCLGGEGGDGEDHGGTTYPIIPQFTRNLNF